jgi:hypothetical protein
MEKNLNNTTSMLTISFNKKININKLYDALLVLDSDEGIRIENYTDGKKIYINRNLLGTYTILVRKLKKLYLKSKDKDENEKIEAEEFFYYDEIDLVLDFIKKSTDNFEIWEY